MDEIRETRQESKDHLRPGQRETGRTAARNVQVLEAGEFKEE